MSSLVRSLVVDNVAAGGGKCGEAFVGGIINDGTLTVDSTTISGNLVAACANAFAGGITTTGDLTLTNGILADNHAGTAFAGRGGGLINSGHAAITNTPITENGLAGAYGEFGWRHLQHWCARCAGTVGGEQLGGCQPVRNGGRV
jgi:hypothetical protein